MRLTTSLLLLATLSPVTIFARPWNISDTCPTEIITIVTENPCDRSTSCSPDPQFTTMHSVHDALRTCPNITVLDLQVTGTGSSSFPSRWNFPFNPAGGETYPRLKTLRLVGYDFWSSRGGEQEPWLLTSCWNGTSWKCIMNHFYWIFQGNWRTWIKWATLPKGKRGKSNGQLWVDAMDWSSIEEMVIECFIPESLKKAAKNFTSLRTLRCADEDFISNSLPKNILTNLSYVVNVQYDDPFFVLKAQGKSLKALEYRCPEVAYKPFFPGFDPGMLATYTTQLEHLSMNIARNGTWPWEDLEQIAAVPTLRSADLWMGIQSQRHWQYEDGDIHERMFEEEYGKGYYKGEDQFQKPYLNDTTALEVFTYIREKKKGAELEKATFWMGDWKRQYGGPVYQASWLDGRRVKVMCKADKDVGKDDWCVVEEGKEYWKDPIPG
jgi:hypothetical protein